jgi:hypothetical protein
MSDSKKKKTPQYEVTAKVLGKAYSAKGKTIQEAITKLAPGNVAGMVILEVKKGKKVKERVIPHIIAKKLFNTAGLSREATISNISNTLTGI